MKSEEHAVERDSDGQAIDPVCGMQVTVAGARHFSEWHGQHYYFCCAGCKARFEASPETYVQPAASAQLRVLAAASSHVPRALGDGGEQHPDGFSAGACCGGEPGQRKAPSQPSSSEPKCGSSPPGAPCHAHAEGSRAEVRDPVCGMRVDPATARHRHEYQGHTYHFCAARCREKFAAAPEAYLTERAAPAAAPDGATYTCPMHPEVQQSGPGDCPKCGMALEPMMPSLDEDDAQPRAMARRFATLLALTLPVFLLAMWPQWGLRPWPAAWDRGAAWVEALLASVVVLWGGAPFFARGWRSLWPWSPNMYTLIALGTGVAWLYSVLGVLVPNIFPASMRNTNGGVDVYFESAAVIVTLVSLGDWLELRARRRTGEALQGLLRLAPKQAHRVGPDGYESDVPQDQLQVGDHLRIRPGEHVPVDGEVIEGSAHVDESMLTGESMPVRRGVGDTLSAGTLNRDGVLLMRAAKLGGDTLLAQIIAMVASAQRSRAPLQRIADRVAAWFVPAVVLVAVAALLAWWSLGPEPRLAHGLVAAVAVLIIACPCALGLATPISIMVASGRAAQLGLLFRDAAAIEALREVDTLLLDKTGTLTEGKPRLVQWAALAGSSRERVLALAAALERGSEHPLARALVESAQREELPALSAADFQAISGLGVGGSVDGHRLWLGNQALLEERGISLAPDLLAHAEKLRGEGVTVTFLAIDGAAAAWFAISDPIKSGAAGALRQLRQQGLSIAMLSGDAEGTARAIANRLGIETVLSGVSPAGKADEVRRLQQSGRRVAMVGDGINDAPALAAAEVGVAMGQGTDIAMQSAGLTLVNGELAGLVAARALSRATVRNIRQNLGFAFGYNAIGVPLAAGVLYPWFGITLSPMLAALAMSLSSVSVVGNALRLRRTRL